MWISHRKLKCYVHMLLERCILQRQSLQRNITKSILNHLNSGWKSCWDTLQYFPFPLLLRVKTVGSSVSSPPLSSAAFVPRTRHTCHLENSSSGPASLFCWGSNTRSNASQLFTLSNKSGDNRTKLRKEIIYEWDHHHEFMLDFGHSIWSLAELAGWSIWWNTQIVSIT